MVAARAPESPMAMTAAARLSPKARKPVLAASVFDLLAEASRQELTELMTLTRRAEIALTEAYRPHGMNMGINLGRPAGAGLPGHLHIHLVPRWEGDTNFMTVVGSTRVVPEEPPQTLKRLTPIFARLAEED